MPDVSFASFSTVIGVLSGIVALLGALYAFAVYRDHLPSARLRHLEELLKEVEDLYKSGIESQLIPSQGFRDEVQNKLTRLRGATYRHRQRAHCAVNLRQQWAEFFRGLSFAIHQTCTEVKILRAVITVRRP
ncbi:hypothetical protein PLICRDRAFT_547136 [Plicaturopsis crispa FD-325 SS-3]|nr:hypothetical protein PLICRDRAFT_547136 [Plicaturopsis crispa FD-325 SS-3]